MRVKTAAAAIAALTLNLSLDAQKGGKVTLVEYPAEITFWSRADDGVKGDGASYRDADRGLKVVFQDNSAGTGNKNFLLNMSRARGRSLTFDYQAEVATSCSDPEPDGPVGTLTDAGPVFWILNALTMPIGTTLAKQGAFSTAVGQFRFKDGTILNPVEPYFCSQLLVVTRLSQTQWRVSTDVDPDTVYFNTARLVVTPGSTAQLDRNDTLRGNYRMSFGADITCPTCR